MFSESSEDDLLDENSPKLQRSNARRFGKVRFIVITGGVHLMSTVETIFSDSKKKRTKRKKGKNGGRGCVGIVSNCIVGFLGANFEPVSCATWY